MRRLTTIIIIGTVIVSAIAIAYHYLLTLKMGSEPLTFNTYEAVIPMAEPHNFKTGIYFTVIDDPRVNYVSLHVKVTFTDIELEPNAYVSIDIEVEGSYRDGSYATIENGAAELVIGPFRVDPSEQYDIYITIEGIRALGQNPSIQLSVEKVEVYTEL